MNRIEVVTVCIRYGDFLAETAKHNAHLFDRWVIVTEPADEETREVCRRHSLECILTDEGKRDGEFCKGWLIERGLHHLSADGWRLHLDADMVLPTRFRHRFDAARLDPTGIYGIDRVMVQSWNEWQKLLATGYLHTQHDYHNRLRFPDGFKMGARWADHAAGYVPIGAFQLWHSSADQWRGMRSRPYPTRHNSAARTDIQHGLQWCRANRHLWPEVIAVHLESEPCELGKNWNGRKTKRFGPECPPKPPKPPRPYC